MDANYYMKFKALYEGNLDQFKKDATQAAEETKKSKLATQEWESAVKNLSNAWGVSSSSIIRNIREVNGEYSKLEQVLGRIGGRIGGAGLGSALGIPGGGFIGSQLFQGLGISGGAALGLGAAAVGVFAAVDVAKHLNQLTEWAQKQENLSREIGVTVGQMQQMSRISEITGVNIENAARSVSKLSESLVQGGSRSKQIREALSGLGLSGSVAFNNPSESLNQIMEAASRISDQEVRIRLLTTLLGDSGRAVAGLADRWTELSSKPKLISDENIQALRDAREKLKEFGESWDVLLSKLAKPALAVISFVSSGGALPGDENNQGTRFGANIPSSMGKYFEGQHKMLTHTYDGSGLSANEKNRLTEAAEGVRDRFSTLSRNRKGQTDDIDLKERTMLDDLLAGKITLTDYTRGYISLEDQRGSIESQESISSLTKQSSDALSESIRSVATGTIFSPQVRYRAEAAKIETNRQEFLRKYGYTAADKARINAAFNNQQIAAFENMQEGARVAISGFGEGAPDSENQMFEKLRTSVFLDNQQVPLETEMRRIFGDSRQAGILGTGRGQLPLPPPGYITPEEQLRVAQQSGRRQIGLLPAQAAMTGMSGLGQADAALSIRLSTARAEYEADLRIANAKKTEQEREEAALDAITKLQEAKFDAEMEHEKSLLELYNQAKSQFAGGIESIILGAQNGGGRGARGALRGFLEGQEATILRNIAGVIFNKVNLPHAGKGPLGDILSGTIFGPREDHIKEIHDETQKARLDLDKIVELLSGGKSQPGWMIPGTGTTINPNGTIGSNPGGMIFNGFPGSGPMGTGGATGGGISGNPIGVLFGSQPGSMVGAGLTIAGAGVGAWQGISNIARGGGKNVAGGVGELLGSAALLDPEPVSKMVLAAAAAVSGLVSAVFGDPRQERAANINRRMFTQQYNAPPAMNLSVGDNGGYTDVSATGDVRSTNFSPYPVVRDPYEDNPHRIVIPGGITSTYGGYQNITGAQGKANAPMVNVTVSTMDSQSFIDNAGKITEAVNHHIVNQDSPLMRTLNQRFQGRNN